MSYCRNCGAEISESGVCTNCVGNVESEISINKKWSILAIVIFNVSVIELIFSVLFTYLNFNAELMFLYIWLLYLVIGFPVSMICLAISVASVCLTVKQRMRGKGLAITSLVMNALSFCMAVVIASYPLIIKIL